MDQLQEAVRERYKSKAIQMASGQSGCCDGGACCDDDSLCGEGYCEAADRTTERSEDYNREELAAVGLTPQQSLGCGNPTLLAELRPGETVLDLGSGAGIDVLLSARRVAPGGHAYGVDMTDEMLAVARTNQERSGITNATFLKGSIEMLPLPDASVDVVISNCVINLAADKGRVLREISRVLRPGGRVAIADMVAIEELPESVKRSLDEWAGCVAGTIPVDEYARGMRDAGLGRIDIELTREVRLPGVTGAIASAYIRAWKEVPA